MKQCNGPMVSIVLPVYNGEKYLRCSIESCLNQTYANWELLIIDDGSTDQSPAIAMEYEAQDSRVHYYKNEVNLKLPRALNRGFSLAKGDYLTWTSDDNYFRPNALEKMVSALESGEAEFVFAKYTIIDENDNETMVVEAPGEIKNTIWHYNFVGACFMYSRKVYETVGDYEPDLFLCEDYDYWLRIFNRFEVCYLNENLYAYRQHPGALSATRKKEQFKTVEKVLYKNMKDKAQITTLDRYYWYQGLQSSRSLDKGFFRKNKYLFMVLVYKFWHKLLYLPRHKKEGAL